MPLILILSASKWLKMKTFSYRTTRDRPPQCHTFIKRPGQPANGALAETRIWDPTLRRQVSWTIGHGGSLMYIIEKGLLDLTETST